MGIHTHQLWGNAAGWGKGHDVQESVYSPRYGKGTIVSPPVALFQMMQAKDTIAGGRRSSTGVGGDRALSNPSERLEYHIAGAYWVIYELASISV